MSGFGSSFFFVMIEILIWILVSYGANGDGEVIDRFASEQECVYAKKQTPTDLNVLSRSYALSRVESLCIKAKVLRNKNVDN